MVVLLLLSAVFSTHITHSPAADARAATTADTTHDGGSRHVLQIGGGEIQVEIRLNGSSLRTDDILAWVRRAADAVEEIAARVSLSRKGAKARRGTGSIIPVGSCEHSP